MSEAITDLAVELCTPFTTAEFCSLHRCVVNAIAEAVTGFGTQRDAGVARRACAAENERWGALVHELRNQLQIATLAFRALDSGKLALGGSTSRVLERSLAGLASMLDESLAQVRMVASAHTTATAFAVVDLLEEATSAAVLGAQARGCSFSLAAVDPGLMVVGNRARLLGALVNGINNAFKFTRAGTHVSLRARAEGADVLIEVEDQCGGLPAGDAASLFLPFAQAGADRTGVGLGLSIARKAVEADGGRLCIHDRPGLGCIFAITLRASAAA